MGVSGHRNRTTGSATVSRPAPGLQRQARGRSRPNDFAPPEKLSIAEWAMFTRAMGRAPGVRIPRLSVVGQSGGYGASVIQRECSGAQDQTIRLALESDGQHVTLRPAHSGMCVDVAEAAAGDGGDVQQWECWAGALNQQWRLELVEDTPGRSVGTLRAAHSGRCLSVVGGSTDNGAGIVQWSCTDALHLRWRIEALR